MNPVQGVSQAMVAAQVQPARPVQAAPGRSAGNIAMKADTYQASGAPAPAVTYGRGQGGDRDHDGDAS